MTPFPEAEIMTIKRLEVALRKMDYKLLKDGAYKLHEKFHSGHKFEYLDLLEEILLEVSENAQVPSDIKDILCPTIEDILLQGRAEESLAQTQIQSTTPKLQEQDNPSKISAFDAFGSQKDTPAPTKYFSQQSPFSAQPFKEFNPSSSVKNSSTPLFFTNQVPYEPKQNEELPKENKYLNQDNNQNDEPPYQENQAPEEHLNTDNESKIQEENLEQYPPEENIEAIEEIQEENLQNNSNENMQINTSEEISNEYFENDIQENLQDENQETIQEEPKNIQEEIIEEVQENLQDENQENIQEETFAEECREKESIAIFYGQDISTEKIKNIIKYRKLLQQAKDDTNKTCEIFKLISEITTQANTNVIELKGILEKLRNNSYKTNLITNSQSAMFFELFDMCGIEYELYDIDFKTDINFSAIYGLSNLFSCMECDEKYLDINNDIRPLILECPKCKSPMYPDFYAPSTQCGINMEYYNSAFASLSNSNVWLLIHPSFNDKISSDMIEYAFRTNKCAKKVYILEKDINVRETYKYVFSKINPNVKIYADNNALEDFLNSI